MSGSLAPKFEQYSRRYDNVSLKREDGILEVRLHTNESSLIWSTSVHEQLAYCFTDIADDDANEIVILTGTGETFCSQARFEELMSISAERWRIIRREGIKMLGSLLDIQVPVIAAVNGPAIIHPEIPLMSNIIIASETATFQDYAHFPMGATPGDGNHIIWPELLGPTRGSYLLLTGQVLDAKKALELGLAHEITSAADLMPRARELARQLLAAPSITRRYTRALLTQTFRKRLAEELSHGLALEGLGVLNEF